MTELFAEIEKSTLAYLVQLPRELIDWWGHPCYITTGKHASLRVYSESGWREFKAFAEANPRIIRDFQLTLKDCTRDYVGTDGVISVPINLYEKALSPEAQTAVIRRMETSLEITETEAGE